MISYIKGNAVSLAMKGHNVAFAHGCNCFCRMRRGIAKEVSERLPYLTAVDRKTEEGSREKLGTFTSAEFDWGVGYNMYTQYTWSDKDNMVDWGNLPSLLQSVFDDMMSRRIHTLIMPKICSGLARGRLTEDAAWARVVKAIEETCPACVTVLVVEYEPDA